MPIRQEFDLLAPQERDPVRKLAREINYILGANVIWHEVGSTGEPAFQNSWANTGVFETAGFYKDAMGWVYLKGNVVGGAPDTAIFTLPTGYRPSKIIKFAVTSLDTLETLEIKTDGRVILNVT